MGNRIDNVRITSVKHVTDTDDTINEDAAIVTILPMILPQITLNMGYLKTWCKQLAFKMLVVNHVELLSDKI